MPKSKKKYASKNTLALLFIALPGITYLIINNLGKPMVWTE